MHCSCCDRLLNDFEATRRNANTFAFIDLCNGCFKDVKGVIPVIERKDLVKEEDYDNFDDEPSEDSTNMDSEDSIDLEDYFRDSENF